MSPILVTLTSRRDPDFERSNISFKENKLIGVDMNSNSLDYCVRNNEGQILWFSADCVSQKILHKNMPPLQLVMSLQIELHVKWFQVLSHGQK